MKQWSIYQMILEGGMINLTNWEPDRDSGTQFNVLTEEASQDFRNVKIKDALNDSSNEKEGKYKCEDVERLKLKLTAVIITLETLWHSLIKAENINTLQDIVSDFLPDIHSKEAHIRVHQICMEMFTPIPFYSSERETTYMFSPIKKEICSVIHKVDHKPLLHVKTKN